MLPGARPRRRAARDLRLSRATRHRHGFARLHDHAAQPAATIPSTNRRARALRVAEPGRRGRADRAETLDPRLCPSTTPIRSWTDWKSTPPHRSDESATTPPQHETRRERRRVHAIAGAPQLSCSRRSELRTDSRRCADLRALPPPLQRVGCLPRRMHSVVSPRKHRAVAHPLQDRSGANRAEKAAASFQSIMGATAILRRGVCRARRHPSPPRFPLLLKHSPRKRVQLRQLKDPHIIDDPATASMIRCRIF